jgi:DNA-3-methyladenine glycosylase
MQHLTFYDGKVLIAVNKSLPVEMAAMVSGNLHLSDVSRGVPI